MTNESLRESIEQHFGRIPDKRVVTRSSHKLVEIIAIAILGILCGADGWVGIETYGKAKEEWLRTFLELPNGIPSHDTFGRVLSKLDPQMLEQNFQAWIKVIAKGLGLEVVAIDGKNIKGSDDRESRIKSLTMVSAWSSSHRLVLGQVAVKQKSNEMQRVRADRRLRRLASLWLARNTIVIGATGFKVGNHYYRRDGNTNCYCKTNSGLRGRLHFDSQSQPSNAACKASRASLTRLEPTALRAKCQKLV